MTVVAVTVVYLMIKAPTLLVHAPLREIVSFLLNDPVYLMIDVISFFFGFYCVLETSYK
jgi:hypothetical protein